MLREKETVVRRAMMLFDGFIVSVAFVFAYFLRHHFHAFYRLDLVPSAQVVHTTPASINDYLVILFFVVPLWCLMLYLNGMYRSLRTKNLLELAWAIVKSMFLMMVTFGTAVFLFRLHFVSRVFFAIFIGTSATFILLEKLVIFALMRYLRKQGYNYRRILIVGTGKRASDFIEKIKKHPEWGITISGAIDDEPGRGVERVNGISIVGTLKDMPDMLHRYTVDEVVFVVPRSRLSHIEEAIFTCETEGVKATVTVDLFDFKIARSYQTELDGIPLLTFETTFAKEWQLFVKRSADIVISAIAMILLSPLYVIVAALIKLTSGGPVLFIQRRVGLNGRRFVLFKFRTMHKGAHLKVSELKGENELKGPVFKMKSDPRVTPVGRFLRKFSIDELPQLFNIFMGCMSLVGPRPSLSKEVNQYSPWQRRRFSMRPGLTCLWQINGRNKIAFEDWMKLDLEYIDNWSLWLDFKILMKTIPVVLLGIGAS